MRHEASKVPSDDAVPRRPLALVKLHRRLAEAVSRRLSRVRLTVLLMCCAISCHRPVVSNPTAAYISWRARTFSMVNLAMASWATSYQPCSAGTHVYTDIPTSIASCCMSSD